MWAPPPRCACYILRVLDLRTVQLYYLGTSVYRDTADEFLPGYCTALVPALVDGTAKGTAYVLVDSTAGRLIANGDATAPTLSTLRAGPRHQQPVRSRARSRQENGGLVAPWRRLLRVAGLRRAWMMGRWTG